MDMAEADRRYFTLTKLGMGVLNFNSALAIYNSWGDAVSVAFVLAANAAVLLLLFLCLREFEHPQAGAGRGRDGTKIKAAVWSLTTLLTAMFAYWVALLMPLAVGVLVFLCLRDVDQLVRGEGRNDDVDGPYPALAKLGLAVLTCSSAVDTYNDAPRGESDPAMAAFVLVSYAVLVVLTGLFVRGFARVHAGRVKEESTVLMPRDHGGPYWSLLGESTALQVVWSMAIATVHSHRRRVLGLLS